MGGRHGDGAADGAVARVVRGRAGQPRRRGALRRRVQLQVLGRPEEGEARLVRVAGLQLSLQRQQHPGLHLRA